MKFNQNKKRIDPRYFLNERTIVEYTEWVPEEMRTAEFWNSPDAAERYKAYEEEHGSEAASPGELSTWDQGTPIADDDDGPDVTDKVVHSDGSVSTKFDMAGILDAHLAKKAAEDPDSWQAKEHDPARAQRKSMHPLLKQQHDFYESGGQPGGACPSGKCIGAEVMPYNSYLMRAAQAKWDREAAKKERQQSHAAQKSKNTPQEVPAK